MSDLPGARHTRSARSVARRRGREAGKTVRRVFTGGARLHYIDPDTGHEHIIEPTIEGTEDYGDR